MNLYMDQLRRIPSFPQLSTSQNPWKLFLSILPLDTYFHICRFWLVVDALLGHTIAESIVFVPIGGCISVEVWQVHKGGKVGGFRGGGFKCFTYTSPEKLPSFLSGAMSEFWRVYIFYFHPYLGKIFLFDSYFSDWLKPPTSIVTGIQVDGKCWILRIRTPSNGVGLMISIPSPGHRIGSEMPFLGHTWILKGKESIKLQSSNIRSQFKKYQQSEDIFPIEWSWIFMAASLCCRSWSLLNMNPTVDGNPAPPRNPTNHAINYQPHLVSRISKPSTVWPQLAPGLFLLLHTFLAGRDKRRLSLCPVIGYGCAWLGHFFVEQNKPASFKYPL